MEEETAASVYLREIISGRTRKALPLRERIRNHIAKPLPEWEELEGIMFKKLDELYEQASTVILSIGQWNDTSIIHNAILSNGHFHRPNHDPLFNIIDGATEYLTSSSQSKSKGKNVAFADLRQLQLHDLAEAVTDVMFKEGNLSRQEALYSLCHSSLQIQPPSTFGKEDDIFHSEEFAEFDRLYGDFKLHGTTDALYDYVENHTEDQLLQLLIRRLDFIYKEVCYVYCDHPINSEIEFAYYILSNGNFYGNTDDIVGNILRNADIAKQTYCPVHGSKVETCSSFAALKKYGIEVVVRFLQCCRPKLTRKNALWCLLMADLRPSKACLYPLATGEDDDDIELLEGMKSYHFNDIMPEIHLDIMKISKSADSRLFNSKEEGRVEDLIEQVRTFKLDFEKPESEAEKLNVLEKHQRDAAK